MLIFPQSHSRLLWAALAQFPSTCNPLRWGWNVPELWSPDAFLHYASITGVDVQVHPLDEFYPIYWRELERLASSPDDIAPALCMVEKNLSLIHI